MTGQRRGEVSGMRRREIDWNRALWTIPEERYKTGETHIVPLSDELMEILQKRPCGSGDHDHLFSADDTGAAPLQGFHHAVTRLRREMRKADPETAIDWVVPDLRRTVRTRLASLEFLLFDHLVRSGKYIWWNGEADLLRSFQIDYQLEFDRLFDGKIRRLCPLQYLVDVIAERRNKSFMLTL